MRIGAVIHVIGWLLVVLAGAMILPILSAIATAEAELAVAFSVSAVLTLFAGAGMVVINRGSGAIQSLNEGLLFVVMAWLIVPLVACFPLAAVDGIPTLIEAWFESVSGLTTTGATLITDFVNTSPAIFLWRALLQWLGGLFILLTATHILVVIGATSLPIRRVKLPVPDFLGGGEDINSRLLHSLVGIVLIYVGLTSAIFLFLWAGAQHMEGWEVACLAFSSISTGGFSTRPGSIQAFQSWIVEATLVVAMLLGSVNFLVHWMGIRGRFGLYFKSLEMRYLVFTLVVTIGAISLSTLFKNGQTDLWHSVFNGVALLSTTGYSLDGVGALNDLPPVLVLIPILIGGAAISTTGGFKVVRFVLLVKHSVREMRKLGHPHGIFPIKFGEHKLDEATMDAVLALFLGFMSVMALLAFVVGWAGYNFEVALIAAAAAVMNAGPVLMAQTGGSVAYADFPTYVKVALGIGMIVGRVEVLAFIVVFNRNFWRR